MVYDCAIIGTGVAGLSAALNLKIHNKNFIWIGSKALSDKIAKAERILNYPGLSNVSGEELAEAFRRQVADMELEITEQMVNSIMPFGESYALMAGSEFYEAKTVILATGIVTKATLTGESDYIGKGVSYCATCDGGLYRGKTIAVVCNHARFEHEVRYLAEMAAKVYYFAQYRESGEMPENVEVMKVRAVSVVSAFQLSAEKCSGAAANPIASAVTETGENTVATDVYECTGKDGLGIDNNSAVENISVVDASKIVAANTAQSAGVKPDRVVGIGLSDGTSLAVDGIFCLRDSIVMSALLPGLAMDGGHIAVNRAMETNLPGVYAAGDCTGQPYQYAKAAGEGNVAAHSVIEYLAARDK